MEKYIPKIIHYCWFGKRNKPKLIKKCINSWKNILYDYEIIEWNEENFDINSNNFVKRAYEIGNYAFVSDYVRVYALYNYGGIYLDTDVEVIKKFDRLLENESFWGFEEENYIATSTIGCKKGNRIIKEFLDRYHDKANRESNKILDGETNVSIVTQLFETKGIRLDGSYQEIKGECTIYPQVFFSPYDYINCFSKKSDDTYTIHYFYKSWLPIKTRINGSIKKILSKIIGGENIKKIRIKLRG